MKYSLLSICLLLLLSCNSEKKSTTGESSKPEDLEGTWVLNFVSGTKIAFDGLYPDRKPEMTITPEDGRISGNTSCNSFSGPVKIEGNKISFKEPMATTRMACQGEGEAIFLKSLEKINTYSVDGKTLVLIMGDIAMMRFRKK